MKKLSETNHCERLQARRDMIKKLKHLGYDTESFSFGVTVLVHGKMVFHGREDEIEKWLFENGEG